MTPVEPSPFMNEHTRVVASANQVSTDGPGEAVILNTETGQYHSLRNVGAYVWKLIQTPITVADIHRTLLERYEVDPDTCWRDLLDLLESLSAEGLLDITDEPTP